MFRFFCKNIDKNGQFIIDNKTDFYHIKRVLRLNIGDEVEIVYNGILTICKIVSFDYESIKLIQSGNIIENSLKMKSQIILYQAIIKPQYFELILEKCTEIGVDVFVPVLYERCQFKKDVYVKKLDRFNKIIMTASKQCKRLVVPQIKLPIEIKDISSVNDDINIIFDNIKGDFVSGIKSLSKTANINYFIGPEGGFSAKDWLILDKLNNKYILKINSYILRSETAAIAGGIIIKHFLMV